MFFVKAGKKFVNLDLVESLEVEAPSENRPHGSVTVQYPSGHVETFTGTDDDLLQEFAAEFGIYEFVDADPEPIILPFAGAVDGGLGVGETPVEPAPLMESPTPNPQPPAPAEPAPVVEVQTVVEAPAVVEAAPEPVVAVEPASDGVVEGSSGGEENLTTPPPLQPTTPPVAAAAPEPAPVPEASAEPQPQPVAA